MSENPETKLPTEVVINGARRLTVKKLDGTTQEVSIKLVPISKLGLYFEKLANINLFTEFLVGEQLGWADTVEDDGLYEIDRIGREINDPRADRLVSRTASTVKRLQTTAGEVSDLTSSLLKPSPAA